MAFGTGVRPWMRGTLAKIAASTAVLGQGELLLDDAGRIYGGDGTTQLKDLKPAMRRGELMVNVRDYGATGDGTTDDTAAFEAAQVASRLIFVPEGTYIVSRGLTLSSNRVLLGQGGKNAAIIKTSATFDATTYGAVLTLTGSHSAAMHLQINAQSVPGVDCFRINGTYEQHIAHVKTVGGLNGIHVVAGLEARVEHASLTAAVNAGVQNDNVADLLMINVSTDSCTYGLNATGGSMTVFHFHAIKSLKSGFVLTGPNSSQFYGCHADTNGEHGFYIFNPNNTRFTDCWSFKNGTANPGAFNNWYFDGSASGACDGNTIIGGGSNQETNVQSSFHFTGTIIGLSMIGCFANGLAPTGSSRLSVRYIGCMGFLAALNNDREATSTNLTLNAGASGTATHNLGYSPNITNNVKVYRVSFTARSATDGAFVSGQLFFTETNGTVGGGVSAPTYFYGASTDPAAQFTFSAVRSTRFITATIVNNSAQQVSYAFTIEPMREAKL